MENDSKYKYFFGKEPAGYFISETESCQFHVAFQRFGVKAVEDHYLLFVWIYICGVEKYKIV